MADLDCNGWPRSGRPAALREIRKGFRTGSYTLRVGDGGGRGKQWKGVTATADKDATTLERNN